MKNREWALKETGPGRRYQRAWENRLVVWILIIGGSLSAGLGILGIFLPLLPTTPFLLLAAACYARSSRRAYNRLLGSRWVGNYIKNYQEGRLPLKARVSSVSLLWIAIAFSAVFVVSLPLARIILVAMAIAVSAHILSVHPVQSLKIKEEVIR